MLSKEYKELLGQLQDRKKELIALESNHADDRITQIEAPHGDELDVAEHATELEMSMTLRHRINQELQLINEALEKLHGGIYGVCENCEEQIEIKRLAARPFVKFCIDCQEEFEKKEEDDTGANETYKFGANE
ncbi:MAG: TraR/DksA C4-type zinc finger protein [Nitrospinota bacterium]|nr:TraR/DksA C4-type zinc finger protein [Nitrospinota bacterium]